MQLNIYALCALGSILAAMLSMSYWMQKGNLRYAVLGAVFGALTVCSLLLWV